MAATRDSIGVLFAPAASRCVGSVFLVFRQFMAQHAGGAAHPIVAADDLH